MIDCDATRELLELEPASTDAALQEHLAECKSCRSYQKPQLAFDTMLRSELSWQAPPELTARLMSLAMAGPAALITPPPSVAAPVRAMPKRWYVVTVYLLTAAAIGLSLAIAWQFISLMAAHMGIGDALSQLLAAPSMGFERLLEMLPVSSDTVSFAMKVREQLLWLLLVAILWAIVDKWNPQFSLQREHVPS